MSYRPITDFWILCRAKLKDGRKYYGSYPSGSLPRMRALLGVSINDPVLHVCSGMVPHHVYGAGGFGPNDKTLDLDPELNPDFLQDCRKPLPTGFKAILADPPYSIEDAEHYRPGSLVLPTVGEILRNSLKSLEVGQRVGILHYIAPTCPKNAKFIAAVAIFTGFNNRIRLYSVYEKIGDQKCQRKPNV